MDERMYLTAEEVSERYRGSISLGTLRNWRAMRIGPAYIKIGKAGSDGLGFFKGIVVDYSDAFGASRTAILPSLSTFGTTKTAQMIKQLTDVNPAIKTDPRITALINHQAR